jgi:hypothetical protein
VTTPEYITLSTDDLLTLMDKAYTLGTQEWFWSQVLPDQGPKDCAIWTGRYQSEGYGIATHKFTGHKDKPASRVSYQLAIGPIPPGKLACHTCDNRPCCRPDHVFPGTHQDNMDDMWAKGRAYRGANHPNAILTEAQVREIYRRARKGRWQGAEGEKWTALAREFGVSILTISAIVRGQTWRHLGLAQDVEHRLWAPRLKVAACRGCGQTSRPHYLKGFCQRCYAKQQGRDYAITRPRREAQRDGSRGLAKLTADDVREIRRRYAAGGVSMRRLSIEFRVVASTIRKVLEGVTWKYVA